MKAAAETLSADWQARLVKVRCPSHLGHDVVEFVANLTAADINIVRRPPSLALPS